MSSGPVSITSAVGRRRRGEYPWLLIATVIEPAGDHAHEWTITTEHATRLEALLARALAIDVWPHRHPGTTIRVDLPVRRSR